MQQDLFSLASEGAHAASACQVSPACAARNAGAGVYEPTASSSSDYIGTMEAAAVSSDLGLTVSTGVDDPCGPLLVRVENVTATENDIGTLPVLHAAFHNAIKTVPRLDRAHLSVLVNILQKANRLLQEMPLNAAFLEKQIEIYGLHRQPSKLARQILVCLDRLVSGHPSLRFLNYERIEDRRVHLLPEAEWPTRFRVELGEWRESVPVKTPNAANPANALTARTIKGYGDAAISAMSALQLSGVRFNDGSGVLFCLRSDAVKIWLKFLLGRQRPATVQATLAGMLRIARDMQAGASCIEFLEARLTAIMGSPAIDTARLAELAEAENFLALIGVPDVLMRHAEDTNRPMLNRLAAGRSALAFQLMWEHPDLSERSIAAFDLRRQIGGSGSEMTLLRLGGEAPEQLSVTAAQLVERLLDVYARLLVSSPYLLPGRNGSLPAASNAMQLVYHQIQSVLHRHVIRSDLRDLNTYLALSVDDPDLAAIAAGAGYKNSKSLALRLGHSADRPKRGAN